MAHRKRGGSPPDPYDAAVRMLAQRPHSAAELRRKLWARGCSPEAVEAALERVRGLGYQDDASFARSVVAYRSSHRGRSAIAAELARRGVGREVAAAALAGLGPDDELEAARRLASRLGPVEPRRLAGRLERRGFSTAVIRAVVELEPLD
ncbi:MAG: recombination regulator RecX [bacterium]|jgi:regulatory protein|nr:recombination regulator RecX [bacterium]